MSWKFYEDRLTLAKSKANNRHEKTQILKGETVFNFLHRHFNLLWMVKTLFTGKPTHSQIVAFRIEFQSFKNSSTTQNELWKKCKKFSIDSTTEVPTAQPKVAVDSKTASGAAVLIHYKFSNFHYAISQNHVNVIEPFLGMCLHYSQ